MKKGFIIFLALSASFVFSCKKDRNCACTETYVGASKNYTTVVDSTISGYKKEEAAAICDKGDVAKQTIYTESREINCELN